MALRTLGVLLTVLVLTACSSKNNGSSNSNGSTNTNAAAQTQSTSPIMTLDLGGQTRAESATITLEGKRYRVQLFAASQALAAAKPLALKWQADAVLFTMSNQGHLDKVTDSLIQASGSLNILDVGNGYSYQWVTEFFSPSTQQAMVIQTANGETSNVGIGDFHETDPRDSPQTINLNFADSVSAIPAGIAIWKQNGKTFDSNTVVLSFLRDTRLPTQDSPLQEYWEVKFYDKTKPAGLPGYLGEVFLDPVTLKLIVLQGP